MNSSRMSSLSASILHTSRDALRMQDHLGISSPTDVPIPAGLTAVNIDIIKFPECTQGSSPYMQTLQAVPECCMTGTQ